VRKADRRPEATTRTEAIAVGRRLLLRPPSAADAGEFIRLARASRALHRGLVTPPRRPADFAPYVRRGHDPRQAPLLVCRRRDGAIVGAMNFSEIVHGNFRSAYLGYYVFAPHARQGYMTEALALALRHAFGPLRLHRVEANIQPGNVASLALVRRAGFRQEGFSPGYLRIGGRWRDHERWALLREQWRPRRGRARATDSSRPS
jgi:ribosomal-protein-alanine N-acetyltransferase